MTIDDIVDGIQAKADKADPIGNSLKLNIGENIVHIDGTGDSNLVSSEDKEADCTVTISDENFKALVKGDLNPMMAFMSGKIKIKGDMGVAMKLQSFLG